MYTTERIREHKLFKKVAQNSGILMFQNICTILLSAFATAVVARHFGAEKFGIFNYVLSITGLFSGIAAIRNKSYYNKGFDAATRKGKYNIRNRFYN